MENPIFYDPSGRRKRWSVRVVAAILLAVLAAAGVFALTIVDVPVPKPLNLPTEHPQPRPLPAEIAHVGRLIRSRVRGVAQALGAWSPQQSGTAAAVKQTVVGFYAPWDDASKASLVRHVGQMDWLVPALVSVTGPNHDYALARDRVLDAVLRNATQRPKVLPMVQNASGGVFDGAGIAALLHDRTARTALLDRLELVLQKYGAGGVAFDFEEIPATSQRDYLSFLAEARAPLCAARAPGDGRGAGRRRRLEPQGLCRDRRQGVRHGL